MAETGSSGSVCPAGKVWILSSSHCPYCIKIKQILGRHLPGYFEIGFRSFPETAALAVGISKIRCIPQIFIGDSFYGGLARLEEDEEAGRLKEVLEDFEVGGDVDLPPESYVVHRDGGQHIHRNASEASCLHERYMFAYEMVRTKTRKRHLKVFRRSFFGKELLRVLKSEGWDDEQVVEASQKLLLFGYMYPFCCRKEKKLPRQSKYNFDANSIYGWQVDRCDGWVLNGHIKLREESSVSNLSIIGERVRSILALLGEVHISSTGVSYDGIRSDPRYFDFLRATEELLRVDLKSKEMRKDSIKKAFFLNIYNSIIIHTTICNGPQMSQIRIARLRQFALSSYIVGSFRFSANDIQHGILRGNRRPPGKKSARFRKGDPRLFLSMELDPRIHFALVCGSKSCPPVRVYSPENVETALQWAAEEFIRADVEVGKGTVHLSKIFYWYLEDFGGTIPKLLLFLCQYLPSNHDLCRMVEAGASKNLRVCWKKYQWGRNDATNPHMFADCGVAEEDDFEEEEDVFNSPLPPASDSEQSFSNTSDIESEEAESGPNTPKEEQDIDEIIAKAEKSQKDLLTGMADVKNVWLINNTNNWNGNGGVA